MRLGRLNEIREMLEPVAINHQTVRLIAQAPNIIAELIKEIDRLTKHMVELEKSKGT